MKSNQLVMGSLVVITLSVAYYLLLYLPKQQDIALRKQTYELCRKEWMESKVMQVLVGVVSSSELTDTFNKMVSNCVEKRLQEYKR